MKDQEQIIEPPFRVDGGMWSTEAPAQEEPHRQQIGWLQQMTWAIEDLGNALIPAVGNMLEGIGKAFESLFPFLKNTSGFAVAPGTQIVKPARGGKTFLAWRGSRWVPVHRRSGQGWFWNE